MTIEEAEKSLEAIEKHCEEYLKEAQAWGQVLQSNNYSMVKKHKALM